MLGLAGIAVMGDGEEEGEALFSLASGGALEGSNTHRRGEDRHPRLSSISFHKE